MQPQAKHYHHRFVLQRDEDVTGISGTGIIAEGTEYSNGQVTLCWYPNPTSSVAVWPTVDDMLEVHGHNGATRVIWID